MMFRITFLLEMFSKVTFGCRNLSNLSGGLRIFEGELLVMF